MSSSNVNNANSPLLVLFTNKPTQIETSLDEAKRTILHILKLKNIDNSC